MERLKTALEQLDEAISLLEDRVSADTSGRQDSQRKMAEILKQGKAREASLMAATQKVALRLDQTIDKVEKILKRTDES